MATSHAIPHSAVAPAVASERAALAHLARQVARLTLHLAVAALPLMFAAWLVYPASLAGGALVAVASLLAGVWLGAWLSRPPSSPSSGSDGSDHDSPADHGRAAGDAGDTGKGGRS